MVDIWSFGIVVLELLTSEMPYKECKDAFQAFQTITSGQKPKSLKKITNPCVCSFIKLCLNMNSKS